jgi:hypothetical protein
MVNSTGVWRWFHWSWQWQPKRPSQLGHRQIVAPFRSRWRSTVIADGRSMLTVRWVDHVGRKPQASCRSGASRRRLSQPGGDIRSLTWVRVRNFAPDRGKSNWASKLTTPAKQLRGAGSSR